MRKMRGSGRSISLPLPKKAMGGLAGNQLLTDKKLLHKSKSFPPSLASYRNAGSSRLLNINLLGEELGVG